MSSWETQSAPARSEDPEFRRVSLRRSLQHSIIDCHGGSSKDQTKPTVTATTSDYGWWDDNGNNVVSTTVSAHNEQQQQHPDDLVSLQNFLLQCDNTTDSGSGGADLLPKAPEQVSARVSRTLQGVPVSVIAQRLCHFLRVQSIEHIFQWEPVQPAAVEEEGSATTSAPAPASLARWYCRTGHMLRFCIFLWRREMGHGKSAAVVVEVQRRAGCSMELQCVRRALFASLLNQDSWSMASTTTSTSSQRQEMLSPRRKMIPSSLCRRVFQKFRSDTPSTDTSSRSSSCSSTSSASNAINCLQRCQNLLESPCRQKKELALEGLLCLTETANGEKQSASQSILTDTFIQQQLVEILTGSERSDDEFTAHDLRTLVLQLLIASLRRLRDTELEAMIDPAQEFWQCVLRTCQSCLSNCSCCNPLDVELAIEILQHVLEVAPGAQVVAQLVVSRIEELQSNLTKAHSLGRTHLLTLEQTSQDLMDHLHIMYHY